MNKLIDWYKENLAKMFSGEDFGRFFADASSNILKYSDLDEIKHIDEILPNNGYKIILIESAKNSGHWVALIRINDNLIFFDSYGIYPDDELNFVSRITNRLLGNKYNVIRNLMKSNPKLKPQFSKTKYQRDSVGVNTCGRWVCIALNMLYQHQYTLPEMKRIFDGQVKEEGKPYDLLAVDYTS
jgi:hypothetical protein